MQQQQQAHAMQQHTRRRRRRRRADGLASHLLDWANQRVEMALPALELAGWGQASLFRRRYGIDGESLRRFLPGEENERERAIITEATDTANQGRGCGVRSCSKSGCWIAPCRSGVFSVGTWRRRSSRLGVPSSFPLPAPLLVMGNKRTFPVAFTLTAISRAPSAPRTAQPGRRSRSLTTADVDVAARHDM